MNKALVLAALALVGCATVHQTYAPDGRRAYALNCSGLARGWDKCMDAAGGSAGYRRARPVRRTDVGSKLRGQEKFRIGLRGINQRAVDAGGVPGRGPIAMTTAERYQPGGPT